MHSLVKFIECKQCHLLIRDSFILSVGRKKCKTSIYGRFHLIPRRGTSCRRVGANLSIEMKRQRINAAALSETPLKPPTTNLPQLLLPVPCLVSPHFNQSYAISASLSISWLSPPPLLRKIWYKDFLVWLSGL